jgi:hypothetical protein
VAPSKGVWVMRPLPSRVDECTMEGVCYHWSGLLIKGWLWALFFGSYILLMSACPSAMLPCSKEALPRHGLQSCTSHEPGKNLFFITYLLVVFCYRSRKHFKSEVLCWVTQFGWQTWKRSECVMGPKDCVIS